jgi:ACT domain-containing protein
LPTQRALDDIKIVRKQTQSISEPGYQDYKDFWRKKTTINYETDNNYNMSIYVEDRLGVKPNLRDRTHRAHIQIIDVNEAPEFLSAELKTTCEVAENTVGGFSRTD